MLWVKKMMNRLEELQMEDKDRLRIPLDLGEWIDRDVLMGWVNEEIASLNWANPELINYLKAHPDFRPRALLTLMTYAYAVGILESDEIVSALKIDPNLKQLWPGPGPSAKDIERFRRQNRALLRWSLVQLLKRAVQRKAQLGDIRYLSGLRQALIEFAGEQLDLARHMDRAAQGA